jgi:hypothetical protein
MLRGQVCIALQHESASCYYCYNWLAILFDIHSDAHRRGRNVMKQAQYFWTLKNVCSEKKDRGQQCWEIFNTYFEWKYSAVPIARPPICRVSGSSRPIRCSRGRFYDASVIYSLLKKKPVYTLVFQTLLYFFWPYIFVLLRIVPLLKYIF